MTEELERVSRKVEKFLLKSIIVFPLLNLCMENFGFVYSVIPPRCVFSERWKVEEML